MLIGLAIAVTGLIFAFWQTTKFSVVGMIVGYAAAAGGLVIFIDRFIMWV